MLGIAATPDGTKVYVGTPLDNMVSVIDTATNTVTDTINVPSPNEILVNPEGTKLYVTSVDSNNNSNNHLNVIDLSTKNITTIPHGSMYWMNRDGTKLYHWAYMNDSARPNASINVTYFDTTTMSIRSDNFEFEDSMSRPVYLSYISRIVDDPDGTKLYVLGEDIRPVVT